MSDTPDHDDPLAQLFAEHWRPPAPEPGQLSHGLARRRRRRNRRDGLAVLGLTALAFLFAYVDPAGLYRAPADAPAAGADWMDVAALDSDDLSADRQLWIAVLGGTP